MKLDLAGREFGRLTVVARVAGRNGCVWQCRCACGGETVTSSGNLQRGHTASCGCLQKERASAVSRERGDRSKSFVYRRWSMMKQRCHNPKRPDYHNYGGRGIAVCSAWRVSFDQFLADVGWPPSRAHKLERRDNERGYEPGNVRWATEKEQARNRRTNTLLTIGDETKPLIAWAESGGIPYGTLIARLRSGWDPRRAVFEQVERRP